MLKNILLSLVFGGMAYDGDGYLWVVTSSGLQACDQNGRVRGILALPADLDVSSTSVTITDGTITLSDPVRGYVRKLNVPAAVPGVTPATQGAG